MAKQNLFKAFTPCEYNEDAYNAFMGYDSTGEGDLDKFVAKDPSPTSWRSVGLAAPFGNDELVSELDGGVKVMAVQINERILPAKVRDEMVAKKIASWERESGRKTTKKEYAQARDEVELELLPKAFIKRQMIPVVFTKIDDVPIMLVCTSSPKKLEDAFMCVRNALTQADGCLLEGIELRAMKIVTQKEPWRVLTYLAKEGVSDEVDRHDYRLYTDSTAVLASLEDKRKVRVKDRAVEAHEIQNLLKQDYLAAELGLILSNDEEDGGSCWITVTEKHVYKACSIVEKSEDGDDPAARDTITTAYMTVRLYLRFLSLFIKECGGLVRAQWEKEEGGETPSEDDDEL